jgi:hypothetical protein
MHTENFMQHAKAKAKAQKHVVEQIAVAGERAGAGARANNSRQYIRIATPDLLILAPASQHVLSKYFMYK